MRHYFAAILITGSALVVNEQPSTYELRDNASHVISKGYATKEACFAAAPGPGRYRCVTTVVADIVGVCDATPKPTPPVVDGFTVIGDFAPQACPGDHLSFTQVQPVRDPYPSCAWVNKPVPVTDCDGRQIAPMEEGNNDTVQTDQTPGPWIEGVDFPKGAPCPVEARGGCTRPDGRKVTA